VEQVLDLDVSPEEAYAALTRFEELPRVLAGAAEVRREAPNRLRWRAREPGDGPAEWTATITRNVPPRELAWEAEDPRGEARAFTIQAREGGGARVAMRVTGPASADAREDLVRLKRLVEAAGADAPGGAGV
jgi:uncharacterized membrane protein